MKEIELNISSATVKASPNKMKCNLTIDFSRRVGLRCGFIFLDTHKRKFRNGRKRKTTNRKWKILRPYLRGVKPKLKRINRRLKCNI